MNKYVGLFDKIRVIKTRPLLVHSTLQAIHESISCVIADIEIIDKLLVMDDGKYNAAVTSHFNKRNQLVIASMYVRNPDQFTRLMSIQKKKSCNPNVGLQLFLFYIETRKMKRSF